MDSSDTTICIAEQISHSYGPRSALTDISFSLPQGTVIGLVGANGSGKSTLLRILSGVQRPSSGTTFLFGENLADSEAAGRGLGAAVDGMALWPGWSVRQNLRYIAGLCGATNEQIDDAAALVDIAAEMKTRLRRLSLGNRQRVLLAAAILAGTRIVLMDEPIGMDSTPIRASGSGKSSSCLLARAGPSCCPAMTCTTWNPYAASSSSSTTGI